MISRNFFLFSLFIIFLGISPSSAKGRMNIGCPNPVHLGNILATECGIEGMVDLESLGYHKAKNNSAKDGLTVYEKGSPLSPSTTRCTIHHSSRLLSFTRQNSKTDSLSP